ncbi:unnamed protein product [Didymodactylos carnosus]|uniref:Alcohol dehydrogenase-like N-terminal domain-containing protein n=1 Tax=Didymodactylos carnosus TaxID=1234261 RepID=A0A816C1M5_9BILA|nr:unnamed protein product [Didymodactylos carnosus]CAF4503944.1 unnamed protein product [Didymodactylos carnosus]
MSLTAKAFAVYEPNGKFQVYDLNRRPLSAHDVAIRILYCGICHTDIHQVKDEWHNAKFPMVPGHEITGIVQQVGSAVKDFKLGDRVGVGCMVDSCRACPPCKRDLENHCVQGFSGTYNSTEQDKVTPTYGGYANFIVVNDHFVVQIPKDLPMDSAAPLLCAGITTYSPMIQHNVGKNTKVGVVGLGGLGHMAVKFGVALKADVTVISTSESKRNDAMRLDESGNNSDEIHARNIFFWGRFLGIAKRREHPRTPPN